MGVFVGAAEIATMLGVSVQRVHQLKAKPGFPPPLAKLTMGFVWDQDEVEQWARDNGRELKTIT